MPRKLREEVAGAIHHVWARGNRQRAIFVDDRDRRMYLSLLGRVAADFEWRCLGYCLMDNHVHLLIETPRANLGDGMQRLHSEYAQYFNARHDLTGHVFQGRYGAKRVRSDAQLLVTAAYIALNPVEAGLCARAEDWRWSSYAATVNGSGPPWLARDRMIDWLTGAAGGDGLAAFGALVRGN